MFAIGHLHKIVSASLLYITLMMAGCATLESGMRPQAFSDLPERVEIPNVPFHSQEEYQCGPAALSMALNWSGIAVMPDELVSQVYVPAKKGTLQVEMVGAARRYGRLAYTIDGLDSLLSELTAGYPVIVFQNLAFNWLPTWHYALVFGYDRESGSLIMNSGKIQRYIVDWTVFVKTWERGGFWGLLVLPPGMLPESASEASYLESVVGLEQVENWVAASVAYAAALERWPTSLGATMGEGNSLYAMGDLAGAEHAFRKAVRVAPNNGSAHNNLAHVLAEQGHYEAALDSIGKAIEAGGPQRPLYEQTQREIKEKLNQIDK